MPRNICFLGFVISSNTKVEMDYEKHYAILISRAQIRTPEKDVYYETHHILPKCLGGDDSKENLVELTAEEHLCAHILLTKVYPYEGLKLAVRQMLLPSSSSTSRESFNKKYANWRRKCQEELRLLKWWHNSDGDLQRASVCPGEEWFSGMGIEPWNKGKSCPTSEETKEKKRGVPQPSKTEESRNKSAHKNTKWWNNGASKKRSIECPGEGWIPGSLSASKGSKGMAWWNNGIQNRLCIICPDGWSKGRLKKA